MILKMILGYVLFCVILAGALCKRYPKSQFSRAQLYIHYLASSIVLLPLYLVKNWKNCLLIVDYFQYFKIQLELKINKIFPQKSNVHLGVLHLFLKTKGIWPFIYIEDIKQSEHEYRIFVEAIKCYDLIDYDDKQWDYLFKKSYVYEDTIYSIHKMSESCQKYLIIFEGNLKKNFLQNCNFNETKKIKHRWSHYAAQTESVIENLFTKFHLEPHEWESILKKTISNHEKYLIVFFKHMDRYDNYHKNYLNDDTWKFLIEKSNHDILREQSDGYYFNYEEFLKFKSNLMKEKLEAVLVEKKGDIPKKRKI